MDYLAFFERLLGFSNYLMTGAYSYITKDL